MTHPLDFAIGPGPYSMLAEVGLQFKCFLDLAAFVRKLPYGRVASSDDVLDVLRGRRGTCSSKHRLLASVAHASGHREVELTVGVFRMDATNTPALAQVFQESGLQFVPEAHCYLTVHGRRYDFTGLNDGAASPFSSLQEERCVEPENLTPQKRAIHERAIAQWAPTVGLTFEAAWSARERCIEALSAAPGVASAA